MAKKEKVKSKAKPKPAKVVSVGKGEKREDALKGKYKESDIVIVNIKGQNCEVVGTDANVIISTKRGEFVSLKKAK